MFHCCHPQHGGSAPAALGGFFTSTTFRGTDSTHRPGCSLRLNCSKSAWSSSLTFNRSALSEIIPLTHQGLWLFRRPHPVVPLIPVTFPSCALVPSPGTWRFPKGSGHRTCSPPSPQLPGSHFFRPRLPFSKSCQFLVFPEAGFSWLSPSQACCLPVLAPGWRAIGPVTPAWSFTLTSSPLSLSSSRHLLCQVLFVLLLGNTVFRPPFLCHCPSSGFSPFA